MEIVRVCISSAAGLVGMARQSRDLAGLCRPWCGLAEIINVCESLALRAPLTEILRV
jgi:hypothetical protein